MKLIYTFCIVFPITCLDRFPNLCLLDGAQQIKLRRVWPIRARLGRHLFVNPFLESSEISLSKSNLRKKIMAFDNRLWVRLQLCNPKTCQKCAKIAAGHGSNLRKSVCQRLLNYKNCCSRTFLLTRGFK